MWDLIVSAPDHCFSFYFDPIDLLSAAHHFPLSMGSTKQTVKVYVKRSKVRFSTPCASTTDFEAII